MAYANYNTVMLRESAISAGTDEQDAAVTLPETVNEVWVGISKTAENNADNLLTVRLQAQVGGNWLDLSAASQQNTPGETTAADNALNLGRTPNMLEAVTNAQLRRVCHFHTLPSNVVRSIGVYSGTGVTHTYEVSCTYREGV